MTDSHTALRRKVEALQRASASPLVASPPVLPDWHTDLASASQVIQPTVFDASTLRQRADLLRALKAAPHEPSLWRDYLNVLNNTRKAFIRENPGDINQHIRMFQALQTLYDRATTVVPMTAANRYSPVYTQLWLDLAFLRAEEDPDDANVIFKRLKSHRIGQTLSLFWNAWADLELRQKNNERAARFRRQAASCAGLGPTTASDGDGKSRDGATNSDVFSSGRRVRASGPTRPARRVLTPRCNTPASNEVHARSNSLYAGRTPGHSPAPTLLPFGTRKIAQFSSSENRIGDVHANSLKANESTQKPQSPGVLGQHARKQSPSITRSPDILRSRSTLEREAPTPDLFSSPDELVSSHSTKKWTKERSPSNVNSTAEVSHDHDIRGNISREVRGSDRRNHATGYGREQSFEPDRNQSQSEVVRSTHRELASGDQRFAHHLSQAERPFTSLSRSKEQFPAEVSGREHSTRRERAVIPRNSPHVNFPDRSGRRGANEDIFYRSPPMRDSRDQVSPPSTRNISKEVSISRADHSENESDAPGERVFRILYQTDADSLVKVNNKPYLILDKVGKGGSSTVFKVLSRDMKTLAMKRVKVPMTSHFRTAIDSYANEIALLRKLRGSPTIVELFDAEVQREYGTINMIMEYGGTDLAKLLSERKSRKINNNFIRMYWQQMLEAVHTIHEARIIHGDLKPANFLVVSGSLKLIDFGIAKAIVADDTTKVVRESQVGTPNYMSPEALMCDEDSEDENTYEEEENSGQVKRKRRYKVGRASDIWSLGCILYQMVQGRPPFAHIKNTFQKLISIQDVNYEISYRHISNSTVLGVLQGCLQRNPEKRLPIPELLRHKFVCPESDTGRAVQGASVLDMPLSFEDSRAFVSGVADSFRRQGVELVISGQVANRGDIHLEKVINGAARDSIRGFPGQGGTTLTGTDLNVGEKRDQRTQPWKGLTTPTASALTPFGTGVHGSQRRV